MKQGAYLETMKGLFNRLLPSSVQTQVRKRYKVRQVVSHRGTPEPELAALRQIVSRGDRAADVGANCGIYTFELSSLVGPEGRVYAFEPIPENFRILDAVVYEAGLSNVVTFHAALAASAGSREMTIPEAGAFRGLYMARMSKPADRGRRVQVPAVVLDDLWRDRRVDSLDFIKCDVEGAELEVLAGAEQLLRAQLPGWLVEVARATSREVFDIFNRLGYRAFVLQGKLVPTSGYRDKEFSNYFFFHPTSKYWSRIGSRSA
jgi:FkbM family methyltransferase